MTPSTRSSDRVAAIKHARNLLELENADAKQICAAIGTIGKPYDAAVISTHAALVAKYLIHPDHVVRHQAIWFLGSWGHLSEYEPLIQERAFTDSDVYNRAYAALCLGTLLKHKKDSAPARVLLTFVEDENEEMEVRLSAYSGLLFAWNRSESSAFLLSGRSLSEKDQEFLTDIHAWIEGQGEMPHIIPPKGIVRSILHWLVRQNG